MAEITRDDAKEYINKREEYFERFINRNKWIFGRTYAKFAPHEYVVKDRLSPADIKVFEEFTLFIRDFGYPAYYGNRLQMYYTIGDYYYWTMGAPVDDTIILNRARTDDYSFKYNGRRKY